MNKPFDPWDSPTQSRTGDFVYPKSPSTAAKEPQLKIPERIGRYKVENILGQGGFGLVYLALDEQLDRRVAIKVPHDSLVAQPEQAEAYLIEARTVARLDHPQIVPVYDVGSTDLFPCFVVSKYIDGTDLETRLRQSGFGCFDAAALIASVAQALDYAHKQGVVHRDIKPGNILLDKNGKPFIGDFGLALREQDIGTGPRYAGTPAYMSPEQASGEGHRVDCRSDVFSLGVVLYRMLANRLPFRAEGQAKLLDLIANHDPIPLRQIDEAIDEELERICLRSMAKRASERYPTARDFAEDLQARLGSMKTLVGVVEVAHGALNPPSSPFVGPTPRASTGRQTTSGITEPGAPDSFAIIPKGLRSFDAHDAGFFLDLLPGPRDRTGLPESIRFWKKRIEDTGSDQAFPVGLIYGPSGCGKSSLVKAGLLPRLADSVVPIFVEAATDGTEARILKSLRTRIPVLESQPALREAMAAIRKGQVLPAGKKALLVIDQFEQWLHSRKEDPNPELVQALRQCDGVHLQTVILVRDDFWLATSRFLRELEVKLVDGQNCAMVDLFPRRHAEKVLAAFGRAFGSLGPKSADLTRDQKQFIEQAVAGLAQDGNVISVRLALFAEMFKGKVWSVANLKSMGGPDGVGVAFLEETFSAESAPMEHRLAQRPLRAILQALLPESVANLRGHMRSRMELVEAAGYRNNPKGFEELIWILDQKLRLITPADPEGKVDPGASLGKGKPSTTLALNHSGPVSPNPVDSGSGQHYQLTHDYLVPALRAWLARKQKETAKGRAELVLADRASIWRERPENRQLPSLLQWAQIRLLVPANQWTPAQGLMMRGAAFYHGVRIGVLGLVALVLALTGWELQGRLEARRLMDRLLESSTSDVPSILAEIGSYRRWVDPLLRSAYDMAETENDPRKRLRTGLGLMATQGNRLEDLFGQLLEAQPQEFMVIRQALWNHREDLAPRLWSTLENSDFPQDRRFHAACALSDYAPGDPRWEKWIDEVVAMLVTQKPFVIAAWTDALAGVKFRMMAPLAGMIVDENRGLPDRGLIATVYGRLAGENPGDISLLAKPLGEAIPQSSSGEIKTASCKKQASLALALLSLGREEPVWPLLRQSPDPTVRGFLINRLGPWGIESQTLIQRLETESNPSIRQAIYWILGGYPIEQLSLVQRRSMVPGLLDLYRNDPAPANHATADWILRRWGEFGPLSQIDRELATGKIEGNRKWYLTRQGQTMAVISQQKVAIFGDENQKPDSLEIKRNFAISNKEVTVEQYLRFRKNHEYQKNVAPSLDCPVNSVDWYDAAAYCNWLSESEGIPRDQWCFKPGRNGKYDETLEIAPDYWKRTGYRLPTELEWEIACRGGTGTRYSFGDAVELFEKNGWFDRNSYGKTHPAGSFPSNDLGLFDMHGNVNEWCMEKYNKDNMLNKIDESGLEKIFKAELKYARVMRGGSYNDQAVLGESGERDWVVPAGKSPSLGFRVARTVQP